MTTAAVCLLLGTLAAEVEMPSVLDDRLQLQLVAAEPDIVTPTGIAVLADGRVLVIESNTHFPLENYKGAPHDRILVLDDFGEGGKAGKIGVFFEGTKHTMNLAVHPDGSIYVATRGEIFRLTDAEGDGRADQTLEQRQKVAWLETKGDYPHNGLSGFAFDLAGNVYFGFGENLGAEYKLIGTDGAALSGGGEGGNIYCCDAEGKRLRRVATGFWNPFHVGFDAFGRLFAVDNDPDSRPPCRLLHIVEGGDYGYRYRNGRKGVHPFTAWNGELPGTLPMVAGTGEAPCAVLAYESDNLPEEYRGDLLVTSWGDHRIERYRLAPRGASFSATMTPVVRGGENFRPVGMALAPDGSLFFSDWVDKSYNVHGKGRVWCLSAKNPPQPSRPADTVEALSSPHGPWREAAARKLSREQAIKVASESKSERARSLAGRAFVMASKPIHAAEKYMRDRPKYFGRSAPSYFCDQLAAAEAEARFRPQDFRRCVEALEFTGRYQIHSPLPDDFIAVATKNSDWKKQRAADVQLPHELLFASFANLATVPLDHHKRLIAVDPFLQHAMYRNGTWDIIQLPEPFGTQDASALIDQTRDSFKNKQERWDVAGRITAVALRRANHWRAQAIIPDMLKVHDESIRLVAVMWIGEERLDEFRPKLESVLASESPSRRLFEATLAALEMLDGKKSSNPSEEIGGGDYVVALLKKEKTPHRRCGGLPCGR